MEKIELKEEILQLGLQDNEFCLSWFLFHGHIYDILPLSNSGSLGLLSLAFWDSLVGLPIQMAAGPNPT